MDSDPDHFLALRPVYRTALTRFMARLPPGIDPTHITRRQFVDARDALMTREFAPATVRLSVDAARAYYDWLLDREVVAANPGHRVKVPVPDNVPLWNVLASTREADHLIASIDSPRDRAIVVCLLTQGWRVSAFCGMRWSDLHETDDGTGVGYVGKRGKRCFDPLLDATREAIAAWWGEHEHRPDDPLMPRRVNGARPLPPLRPHRVYKVVRRWASAVGLRVTPHGLRATAISRWIREAGIEYARRQAHHTSIGTTQRYDRWALPKR